MSLRIEGAATLELPPATLSAIVALCDEAYEEPTAEYFENIGPGEHLLCWMGERLLSHLMWVERWLQPAGRAPLRTAYIEMVATADAFRNRGHATQLLEASIPHLGDFEIAALAPATEQLYRRLGWECWRGPLSVRKEGRLIPTPDECVMVRELPRTPVALDWDGSLSIEWRPGEVW